MEASVNQRKRILTNVFWSLLGKAVSMLAALVVGILVARYLGPARYGLMNYVISYVTLFTILSYFGLDEIEIRELSRRPDERDSILGTAFRLRLLLSSVTYLLVLVVTWLTESEAATRWMIAVYALMLFSGTFNVIRNYFTSIVFNEYVVKSEIVRTLLGSLIKIVLLLAKAPLPLFVAACCFETFLVASGYVISYRIKAGSLRSWSWNSQTALYLLKESLPLLLSGAAVILYQRIDQVMIGKMLDDASVGYYATAGMFVGVILFLPQVLTQTVTPILIRIREQEESAIYAQKKEQFVGIVVWLSILLSLGTCLLSYWLIALTYGQEYLAAVSVLQILSWKTVGMALGSSSGQIIIMERIQKWAVIRNLMACVVCIGFNYLLIPRYGIIGSAWVSLITVVVAGCLGNAIIPPYREVFKMQLKALFLGWKELPYLKSYLKK